MSDTHLASIEWRGNTVCALTITGTVAEDGGNVVGRSDDYEAMATCYPCLVGRKDECPG